MARFGRNERLCNWLSLESWMGMLIDALFRSVSGGQDDQSAANVYAKILGPESDRLINASLPLLREAVDSSTIQNPQLLELVADLCELAVTSWLPSDMASLVEAPTKEWLKVYLGKEAVSGLYSAFKQEDRVWVGLHLSPALHHTI